MSAIRLGTRASALALAQARSVAAALGGAEVVPVETRDDDLVDKSRFVRGVEWAILDGEVDVGVHSAKDVPAERPDGLTIVGVPGREPADDAYVGAAASLEEIPEGARVGTSSLRRRSQLLAARPDLEVSELHGNVDTRLAKLAAGECDGIVVAAAGLRRLGRDDEISFTFGPEQMTPAAGQGALILEARSDDHDIALAVARLNDRAALAEVGAERAATAELGASCSTPIGIRAIAAEGVLRGHAYVGLPDGSEWVRDTLVGEIDDPVAFGRRLASRLRAAGAGELLERAETARL